MAITIKGRGSGGDAVMAPRSRSVLAIQDGTVKATALEAGKFFPQTTGGHSDPAFHEDTPNSAPPADGKIASAGNPGAAQLDRTDIEWAKHQVVSGEVLDVTWSFTVLRTVRRFNYFLTNADWDPTLPLARSQFEDKPFYTVENTQRPFWNYQSELAAQSPTTHSIPLPQRTDYQVLLAVCEIADTGTALYQVIDLSFDS
ncbi:lytic polysaccharide monooxygenase [Streptomyces sp. NBC_00442]|uniref:lytic polysaccharide monooxygenase auxiliary activity family 9 protein n=1 Tax=Streptomyces sp. NBC_00442 TaxID=2903651 RepID=UPI002E2218ED